MSVLLSALGEVVELYVDLSRSIWEELRFRRPIFLFVLAILTGIVGLYMLIQEEFPLMIVSGVYFLLSLAMVAMLVSGYFQVRRIRRRFHLAWQYGRASDKKRAIDEYEDAWAAYGAAGRDVKAWFSADNISNILLKLSNIDSLEALKCAVLLTRGSRNERLGAIKALRMILTTNIDDIFEQVTFLLQSGVPAKVLEDLAKEVNGIGSAVISMYALLLTTYEETLSRALEESIKTFKKARHLRHGEETYLVYNLFFRLAAPRFFKDIIGCDLKELALLSPESSYQQNTVEALKRFADIIDILSRSERVEIGSKLPYYAEVLDIFDDVERNIINKMTEPDERIARIIIARWRDILLERIKELKGRASLSVDHIDRFIAPPRTVINLRLRNDGTGVAENVTVIFDPDNSLAHVIPERKVANLGLILAGTTRGTSFRIKSGRKGSYRIPFRIEFDDLERKGKVLEFADTISFAVEKAKFIRLEPNPYIAGPPLRTSEMFFGREDAFEFIQRNLKAKSQDNIIVFHAERRTGKTSILYQLPFKLDKRYIPVYVDLQGMLDPGTDSFLYDIALRIHNTLQARGIPSEKPKRDKFRDNPGEHFRDEFLREVNETIGKSRLVLMIDEFEVLEDRVKADKLDKDIFEYLRNLMQHCAVDFIFAGTYDITKIAKDYWSVLFNIALWKRIELLKRVTMEALVKRPVEGFFDYDQYAIDRIWEVTGGHPFFTQLLCRELVNYGNKNHISYFTVQDVNNIVESLMEAGEIHLGYIWDRLSPERKKLLVVLSNILASKGLAILSDIKASLEKYNIALDLDDAIRELQGRGIISEQEGRFRFQMGLIGEWINKTKSLESLV